MHKFAKIANGLDASRTVGAASKQSAATEQTPASRTTMHATCYDNGMLHDSVLLPEP